MSKTMRVVLLFIAIIFFGISLLAHYTQELLVRIETLEADSITETQTIYVMQATQHIMLLNQRTFADHVTPIR